MPCSGSQWPWCSAPLIGLAVSQIPLLRRAIGSMIAALQTMPSIVWFPLAILLFQLSETAIFFVVVLGAAPSIANGLISGVDHIPPFWLRAGKVLGARRSSAWRHVVIPAAVPTYIAGMKQGWAFAWRSLMAGELSSSSPRPHRSGFGSTSPGSCRMPTWSWR